MRGIYSAARIDAALITSFKTHYMGPPGPPYLGRLGFKKESAGKIRVFAMVDC